MPPVPPVLHPLQAPKPPKLAAATDAGVSGEPVEPGATGGGAGAGPRGGGPKLCCVTDEANGAASGDGGGGGALRTGDALQGSLGGALCSSGTSVTLCARGFAGKACFGGGGGGCGSLHGADAAEAAPGTACAPCCNAAGASFASASGADTSRSGGFEPPLLASGVKQLSVRCFAFGGGLGGGGGGISAGCAWIGSPWNEALPKSTSISATSRGASASSTPVAITLAGELGFPTTLGQICQAFRGSSALAAIYFTLVPMDSFLSLACWTGDSTRGISPSEPLPTAATPKQRPAMLLDWRCPCESRSTSRHSSDDAVASEAASFSLGSWGFCVVSPFVLEGPPPTPTDLKCGCCGALCCVCG